MSRRGGCDQRPKNPYSKLALLSGNFLRVRKFFARMMKKLFWTAQFALFVWLTKIRLTLSGIPQHLQLYNVETVLKSLKLSGQFWNCLDGFKTVWTVLKLSGRFENCLDGFKTVLYLNMKHGKQKVSSPFVRPSCDTQNLVLSELSLFIPSQNLKNKI